MNTHTVLITGASSGIGLELARLYAAQGHRLVLIARRQDVLHSLAEELRQKHQIQVTVLVADLADREAPRQIVQVLTAQGVDVDVLVNNAGFGLNGWHVQLDEQKQLDMVQVNITALVHLTRLLLPGMVARRRGGVLNVASTAAFQAGPGMAVYYASKAFVLSYTEALHEELKHSGLHISCLCPGPTETEFVEVAGMQGVGMFKFGAQTAQAVAQCGVRGLAANQAIAVSGLKNQVLAGLGKFIPRWLTRRVAGFLNSH
jgi:short-subunit dehydrogenase